VPLSDGSGVILDVVSSARADAAVPIRVERSRVGGAAGRVLEVDGAGTPWLLIHGYGDSADTWRPILEKLGAAGTRARAIDLGGFGAGARLDMSEPLLPQWDRLVAAHVGELAAESETGEVRIAGNSLGGCLTMRAAQDQSLPIAGIVPIAPAGLDMARWFGIIEGAQLIQLLRLSPVPVPEAVVRQIVGRVYSQLAFAHPGRADKAAVDNFTRHIHTVARGRRVLSIGRKLLTELDRPFKLEQIACPLLLVWGDRDRMVYTTGAEKVLRAVDYSDIEIIDDCGHCPQVDCPDRLWELIKDFPEGWNERQSAAA